MIFVDTNIVIEVIENTDGDGSRWSNARFRAAAADGELICNLIVVAELAAGLHDPAHLLATLRDWRISVRDLSDEAALRAGQAFREYRLRGGQRSTILPDFLIAAHAETLDAQLMTRDRRLASYFPQLTLITPETHP